MYDDNNKELIDFLRQVPDPRKSRGVRYRFEDLLLMSIYSILAGYSEASEIAYYVELNMEYFKELLNIEQVPSHDTFSRMLRMVNFEHLSSSLSEWLNETFPEICEKTQGRKILHVDGKATRAASEKSYGEGPIYHLNAMYEGESIGVKVKRVGEKENEITCLPKFLNMFQLKDTIVTIDAIGCNQNVIGTIEEGEGKYVIPVKENQGKLLETITQEVERLCENGEYEKLDKTELLLKNHGRIEKIEMSLITDTAFIYEKLGMESFYGSIARIGIMDKTIHMMKKGKEERSKKRSVLITNLEEISVENLLKIKLAHWNIEMQHWLLDMQLGEDRKSARKDNAVTNGGILRRFCMMVRKYDKEMATKPMKRFLMSNKHDIRRIEGLLFGVIATKETNEDGC